MPMGAACYAAAILVIERLGKMFWTLTQIEKDRERFRKEGREQGREEGREEGREDERARIERELEEQGIALPPEAIQIIRSSLTDSARGKNVRE